jgi:hypothetical protein
MQTLYLEPEQAKAFEALAKRTRITKSELLREAVDDLLVKHGTLNAPKRLRRR